MITTTQAYKDNILSDHREMKMKVILNVVKKLTAII